MTKNKCFGLTLITFGVAGVSCFAASNKPVAPKPAPVGTAEVRIASEVVPAGGTVQLKYSFTNPEPIMSGGMSLESGGLFGISFGSIAGDAAGIGVLKDGLLSISAISPLGDLGGATDYPFMTVTMRVPPSLAAGTTLPLTLNASSLLTASGALTFAVKPATLTVGGNFSVHGVTPGGGTWPAGTTIRIAGNGFLPTAQLKAPKIKIGSFRVSSSSEIEFTLKEQTTMDAQLIQVLNGSFSQSYYSYLRGVPVRRPTRSSLRNVDPVFQLQTHALASSAPFGPQASGRYDAIAIQNPNTGPAAVTLRLTHLDGTVDSATVVLPSGGLLMDDISSIRGSHVR